MRFKEFLKINEIHGTNTAISSVDDEGEGVDARFKDMQKPQGMPTYDLPREKKIKKKKTFNKRLFV